MKTAVALVLLGLVAGTPLVADAWVLQTGPEAVGSIPLDPLQPVPAWRGLYVDGTDQVWVYLTESPHFFKPTSPTVRTLAGTPWTLVAFFPSAWSPAQRTAWLDRWVADFTVLATLPDPGWPVLFPSVLRKG